MKNLYLSVFIAVFALLFNSGFSGLAEAHTDNHTHNTNIPHNIFDGDVVREYGSDDVFIIKINEDGDAYKRLVLNPTIFDSYGHLKWENVKIVNSLDGFQESSLVREVYADGSPVNDKIYKLYPRGDKGVKALFSGYYDANSVYSINHIEASEEFYATIEINNNKDTSKVEGVFRNGNKIVFQKSNGSFESFSCSRELLRNNQMIEYFIAKNGVSNDVCIIDEKANTLVYKDIERVRALYSFKLNFIVINQNRVNGDLDRILLHELMHAVQDKYVEDNYNPVLNWNDTEQGQNFIKEVGFERVKNSDKWVLSENSPYRNMYNYNPLELYAELGVLKFVEEYKNVDGNSANKVVLSFMNEFSQNNINNILRII